MPLYALRPSLRWCGAAAADLTAAIRCSCLRDMRPPVSQSS